MVQSHSGIVQEANILAEVLRGDPHQNEWAYIWSFVIFNIWSQTNTKVFSLIVSAIVSKLGSLDKEYWFSFSEDEKKSRVTPYYIEMKTNSIMELKKTIRLQN